MNPLGDFLQNLIVGGGGSSDWLWLIDEPSLTRHIATRQAMQLHRLHGNQSGGDLLEVQGETAVIRVHGVMLKEAQWSDEISTPAISEALSMAVGDDSVRSILLDVDSPGGSAAGLVQLAEAVTATRAAKPLVVQSSGMIASAAYFMAAGADKIYAARGDLIGSIGTRLHIFDFSQLFENIGVKSIPIDTGPLKSTGAFGTEITEDQRTYLQKIVDGYQAEFKSVVQAGRGFDEKQFQAVSEGGVMHVTEARKLGLIDGIRTKTETLGAMPKRRSSQLRSKTMLDTNNENIPQAATLAELKENLPGASSDFLIEQQEKKATLPEAMKAHFAAQQAVTEQLQKEKEEAESRATAAEEKAEKAAAASTTDPPKKRGNSSVGATTTGADENSDSVDYRQMAEELMEKKNIGWQEACRQIKKRHPDALEAFIAAGSAAGSAK